MVSAMCSCAPFFKYQFTFSKLNKFWLYFSNVDSTSTSSGSTPSTTSDASTQTHAMPGLDAWTQTFAFSGLRPEDILRIDRLNDLADSCRLACTVEKARLVANAQRCHPH